MIKVNHKDFFIPSLLNFFLAIALCFNISYVKAREFFNPEFLEQGNHDANKVDLSIYEAGSQAPGIYHVEIVIDGQVMDTRDIEFVSKSVNDVHSLLQPCLSLELLKSWGIKTELFPSLSQAGKCIDLTAIPKASADFQFNTQRLVLSIPQAALSSFARGYVSPGQWDEGINAAILNYSLNGSNNWARNGNGIDTSNQYANLRPGINIGPWRLRNYTTWTRDSSGKDKWDTVYTYGQRAIIPLKAQLTTGDNSSPADVFDSIPFRGAQLASDDDMMPDSLKGYAPVVRGIARTNAQVIIRQNGYQIYQSYVAPGAFAITDMYPTGGAGDLDVTVKESDGSEQHFTVAFASLPVLQREGQFKYAVTGGQYRSYNNNVDKTLFSQLTSIYGMAYGLTLYGGFQEASKYQSVAVGVGKNMGEFGAFSTDVTQSWGTPKDTPKSQGQSWRIRYSKNLIETGTNFTIAGYRYSTSGYYGMQEVLNSYGDYGALQNRRRNRTELTMSQNIGQYLGSLMLSAVREDYWNSDNTMESYSGGYNNSWNSVNYGITYTYSKNGSNDSYGLRTSYDKDQQIALNLSVPLEKLLPRSWANYSMNRSKNNGTTHSMGLNGSGLENNALSWNVQQGYGTDNVGYTGNANADYRGTYGEITAGYGYDKDNDRLNYGLQGGIIAHADGVTFSQPLGETNVLVKAPGANGVGIQNQSGAKTDWRGYTAVNNVAPFRKNEVRMMTDTLPDNVEVDLTSQTVIPTRGAVVRADYVAKVGLRVLMTLTQQNGRHVPFGAVVNTGSQSEEGFIVGDAGQVYLTGLGNSGVLRVVWGQSTITQCKVKYFINHTKFNNGIVLYNALCS